jgi:hypothetical protein
MSSELKANKVSPATGTALEIGDSGDTITCSGTAVGFGGGKILQAVTATYDTATTMSSTSYASTGLSCSITPAATSSKILILYSGMVRVWANSSASGRWVTTAIYRVTDTTVLTEQTTKEVNVTSSTDLGWAWSQCFSTLDSPSTASSVEYRIDGKVNNASVHRSTYQNEGSDSTLTLLEIGA